VGAHAQHLAGAAFAALDHADHAGLADARHHLVAAERLELVDDYPGGALHLIQNLGVLMDVAAPLGDLVLHGGNAVDDGHEGSLELLGAKRERWETRVAARLPAGKQIAPRGSSYTEGMEAKHR